MFRVIIEARSNNGDTYRRAARQPFHTKAVAVASVGFLTDEFLAEFPHPVQGIAAITALIEETPE